MQKAVESAIRLPAERASQVRRDVHERVERAPGRQAGHIGQLGDSVQDKLASFLQTGLSSRPPTPAAR